jgi:hypothetical protein
MAKKKEETVDFSDKTLADVYEGEVCNNLKLIELNEKVDKLIEIFDNINKYVNDKRNGTLTV